MDFENSWIDNFSLVEFAYNNSDKYWDVMRFYMGDLGDLDVYYVGMKLEKNFETLNCRNDVRKLS